MNNAWAVVNSLRRKFTWAGAGIVIVIVGALFGASPASAHNTFSDSSPRDGEVLVSAPATWQVTFEKSVPLESASGSIINGDGTRLALPTPQHGATDQVIVFAMPPGLTGSISARWRLVSTDGHVISGRVGFVVQAESTIAPIPTPTSVVASLDEPARTPDAVRVALRFANFAAIVLLGGLLFTDLDIASGALSTRRGRKLAKWSVGSLAAVPTAQFLIFAHDIGSEDETYFSAMTDAVSLTAGSMLVVRVLTGLALAWIIAMPLQSNTNVRTLVTPIGICSLAYLVSLAYGGHSRSQAAPWLGVPLDVVHTTAIAVWLGGLTMLLLVVVPSVNASSGVAAFFRFSPVAQRAVVIIAITGFAQTLRLHGSPLDLFSNTHGLLLITKIVLVAIMIRFAARNRRVLQNHRITHLANLERSRELLSRATTSEILFGGGVLGVTAVLVAVTPG